MTIEEKRKMYKEILAKWNTTDTSVLAQLFGVSGTRVAMIAGRLRKLGFPLISRSQKPERVVTPEFLAELKAMKF